jgi:serine/threonine-protein kinase
VGASKKAEAEGDALQAKGEVQQAAAAFRKAFILNPKPELALKLGGVYTHLNPKEARGWLQRYLDDMPDSKHREGVMKSLQSLADSSEN